MSTGLAIAAVKAQALWDAAEQLRQQAAELHPEFARMLQSGDVDVVLAHLRANAQRGVELMDNVLRSRIDDPEERRFFEGKREGVAAIRSYIDEALGATRRRTDR